MFQIFKTPFEFKENSTRLIYTLFLLPIKIGCHLNYRKSLTFFLYPQTIIWNFKPTQKCFTFIVQQWPSQKHQKNSNLTTQDNKFDNIVKVTLLIYFVYDETLVESSNRNILKFHKD